MADKDPKAAAAPQEEVKNCPACNKPLKRAKRYYRNGRYFCNKNCFHKASEKQAADKKAA